MRRSGRRIHCITSTRTDVINDCSFGRNCEKFISTRTLITRYRVQQLLCRLASSLTSALAELKTQLHHQHDLNKRATLD
jgi:hypothetical protein